MFMTLRVVLDQENRRGDPCGRPNVGRHKACPYIFGGMTPLPSLFMLSHFILLFFFLVLSNPTLANDLPLSDSSTLPGIITIEGRQLPTFLQHSISTIQVYAFHSGNPQPIPYQVDERDHRNRWALDQGPQPKLDDSSGVFDENDVLVLMDRDLGPRGALTQLPKESTAWVEVRIGTDTAPLGFAYVGLFPKASSEPEPHTSYTRYDPQADKVDTDRYSLAFSGTPFPSFLTLVDQIGATSTNLINGIRVIGEVRFLKGLLTLRRTDQHIHSEVLAYRHGRIRTIRRAHYWIPLPFGFRTNGRIDVMFYRDVVEGTTVTRIKVPPRLILADGELQAYFRFLDLTGARLIVEGQANAGVVDGRMDDTERVQHQHPVRWAALALPNGRTLLLIARLEGALQKLEQRLYFDDNQPDNAVPGPQPHFGFEFSRVNQLETGTHRLSIFAITLDSTRIEDIHHTVERFLTPPQIHVTPILPGD
jgi:hypothetical protein